MRIWKLVACVMLVLAAVVVAGYALETFTCDPSDPACAGKECGPGGCPLRVPGLNLNIQQKNRIDAICSDHTSRISALQNKLVLERGKLASIMDSRKPDKTSAFAQLKKVNGIELEMQKADLEAYIATKAELTPAQAVKISASEAMRVWGSQRVELK